MKAPPDTLANGSFDATLRSHARTAPDSTVLSLFHRVVDTVPAYQAFLAEQGVEPSKVRCIDDFRRLPLVTKDNYVRRYPLAERCRHGRLDACETVALSSGSTGEPTAWPRSLVDEIDVARRFEQVFRGFSADTRRTLAVVCFPLGTWVGGMYTAACCRMLAQKGLRITVVTPGNHAPEILGAVSLLSGAGDFDQVVLLGYPPFLKVVIDAGIARGFAWGAYTLKLVIAGEVVTEEWRSWMVELAGMSSPIHDVISLYGTADAGVLGNETPVSIVIRRYLSRHPDVAKALLGKTRLPTLVQYDPHSRFFETHEDTLVFSADGGVPLIRYHIADTGGLIEFDAAMQALRERGFDPREELGERARDVYPLPFAYVFGRSHNAISFCGANVFPEMVSVGLEQPHLRDFVTGKFVMHVVDDENKNMQFGIVIELALGVEPSEALRSGLADSVTHQLVRLNREYAAYVPEKLRVPRIDLRAQGDADYFPVGSKHRWTRR